MRLAIAALLVGGNVAHAAPRVTWADWVGAHRGRLAWSGCTTPGAATATLPIEAVDGVLAIDLTAAGRALRRFALVEDAPGTLSARDGDVDITLTRRRADCDRLAGWTHVAARCTKGDDLVPPSETRFARCRAASERLELALIDAGCAPHPDGALAIRSTDCSALDAAAIALGRCSLPPPVEDPLRREAAAVVAASRSADRATLPSVERACREVRATIAAIALRYRCP